MCCWQQRASVDGGQNAHHTLRERLAGSRGTQRTGEAEALHDRQVRLCSEDQVLSWRQMTSAV